MSSACTASHRGLLRIQVRGFEGSPALGRIIIEKGLGRLLSLDNDINETSELVFHDPMNYFGSNGMFNVIK